MNNKNFQLQENKVVITALKKDADKNKMSVKLPLSDDKSKTAEQMKDDAIEQERENSNNTKKSVLDCKDVNPKSLEVRIFQIKPKNEV